MSETAFAPPPVPGKESYEWVDIERCVQSKLHRRCSASIGDLKDLASSIRAHGVLQALLGRRLESGDIELAIGERRRRAALLAKERRVPVVVRDMTDEQMVEVQLHENAKRQDLHPMDEAELYEDLHRRSRTAQQIAQRLGIDPAHVRRRLKLCSLSRKVRTLYIEGRLSDYAAFAIARIGSAVVQERFADEVDRRGGRDLPDEQVSELLRRSYVLPLASAPWSMTDERLDPAAGSCHECPKRTLEQREMFPDVYESASAPKEDYCTDAGCWKGKMEMHWRATVAAAGTGAEVVNAKEAAALFAEVATPGERRRVNSAEYVDADALSRDLERTWRQAVGTPPPVLARDPDGLPRWLYPAKVTRAVKRKAPTAGGNFAQQERAAARAEAKQARTETEAVVDAAAQAARGANVQDVLAAMMPPLFVALESQVDVLSKLQDLAVEDLLSRARGAQTSREYLVALVLREAADQSDDEAGVPEVVTVAAGALGVDVAAVRKAAR